jgi:hypothetical protein
VFGRNPINALFTNAALRRNRAQRMAMCVHSPICIHECRLRRIKFYEKFLFARD